MNSMKIYCILIIILATLNSCKSEIWINEKGKYLSYRNLFPLDSNLFQAFILKTTFSNGLPIDSCICNSNNYKIISDINDTSGVNYLFFSNAYAEGLSLFKNYNIKMKKGCYSKLNGGILYTVKYRNDFFYFSIDSVNLTNNILKFDEHLMNILPCIQQ